MIGVLHHYNESHISTGQWTSWEICQNNKAHPQKGKRSKSSGIAIPQYPSHWPTILARTTSHEQETQRPHPNNVNETKTKNPRNNQAKATSTSTNAKEVLWQTCSGKKVSTQIGWSSLCTDTWWQTMATRHSHSDTPNTKIIYCTNRNWSEVQKKSTLHQPKKITIKWRHDSKRTYVWENHWCTVTTTTTACCSLRATIRLTLWSSDFKTSTSWPVTNQIKCLGSAGNNKSPRAG